MFRLSLMIGILLFNACANQHPSTKQKLLKSTDLINSDLSAKLKANIFRTNEITNSSIDWTQPPEHVSHIPFQQLTLAEKQTYLILEERFVGEWIQCNGKEYIWENDTNSSFYFFEIMNYKPRVEINTLSPNSDTSIQWNGNIRIGIFNSLARDVIPHQQYTYLAEAPEQSLPNFSFSYHYKNAYLKNDKLYTDKHLEIKPISHQRDCQFISKIMKTTGN